MPEIRAEVLRFPQPDGGLDLLDPIMNRLHRFDPAQAAEIEAQTPQSWKDLEALCLLEGPSAEAMRQGEWNARVKGIPERVKVEGPKEVDWSLAADLSPWVSPSWRDPERMRRVSEEHSAGRRVLILRGFFTPEATERLIEEVSALDFTRFETDLVKAERRYLRPHDLPHLQAFFHHPTTRLVLGGLLGLSPEPKTTINAWRLGSEDYFRAHVDGINYLGTFSIGLCQDWRAQDGGAIAFGAPQARGFKVEERWIPHAGDLCLFRPPEAGWHVVEPVAKQRLTLTGWWMCS